MENIQKKKFRTAVNGYNKEDVTLYIRELSKKISEAERDSKEEIESLKSQIAELEERLAAAGSTPAETADRPDGKTAVKDEKGPRSAGRERRIQLAGENARAASTRKEREMIHIGSQAKKAEEEKTPLKGEEKKTVEKKETADAPAVAAEPVVEEKTAEKGTVGLPEEFDSYLEELKKSSEEMLKEFERKFGLNGNE